MTFEEWLEKSDLAVTDLQRNCMKLGWDACAAEMRELTVPSSAKVFAQLERDLDAANAERDSLKEPSK